MILLGRVALLLALTVSMVPAQSAGVSLIPEVFQVFELPITITNPTLVKSKHGYVLKCALANASEFRQLGFRYSLAVIDSGTGATTLVSRNEGFTLGPYQTKNMTFTTPLRLKLNGDERLVLMPEQVISTDYVWEVVQAKDALASYISGDYSTTPRVMRMLNQVDAPVPLRIIF
jgi:hypothetical protein